MYFGLLGSLFFKSNDSEELEKSRTFISVTWEPYVQPERVPVFQL
jgi:hypothetical protein